jgi:subtilisin family serine protease
LRRTAAPRQRRPRLGRPERDEAIEAAVDLAVPRGSLVVAASGNDGDRGNPLSYPAAFRTC